MEVTFLGMNCVRLTGKDIAVLADPYPKSAGLPDLKATADVTLLSVQDLPHAEKGGMVIDGPGEYEVKGSQIHGVGAHLHIDDPEKDPKRATVFTAVIDGVRVGIFGNIAPNLDNEQLEAIGQVDVLVIPVGGHGLTLDAAGAAGIISQLEPKYVIPTHYDDGKTKYEMPQDKLEVFLKEVGSNPEPVAKLKVTERDLPLETTVAVLQRQGA